MHSSRPYADTNRMLKWRGRKGVSMKSIFICLTMIVLCLGGSAARADWTESSKALLAQAQRDARHQPPAGMQARAVAMPDGRGFFLVWTPAGVTPSDWIVSMPGTHGLATDEFALWAPFLQGGKIGLVEVQWWLGTGDDTADYLAPQDIYRALDQTLPALGAKPGHVLLHGFSRGSSNVYAVAALDNARGHKYFRAVVANSGGMAEGYPPTRHIIDGDYGTRPFAGQKWVTVCGSRDPHPERDGCPAMRRTAAWLKEQGGEIAFQIEDAQAGHGALHTNPANARKLVAWFSDAKTGN